METISAEVGVEVGDTLLMSCNRMIEYRIVDDNGSELKVQNPAGDIFQIPHDHLRLYLVVVK